MPLPHGIFGVGEIWSNLPKDSNLLNHPLVYVFLCHLCPTNYHKSKKQVGWTHFVFVHIKLAVSQRKHAATATNREDQYRHSAELALSRLHPSRTFEFLAFPVSRSKKIHPDEGGRWYLQQTSGPSRFCWLGFPDDVGVVLGGVENMRTQERKRYDTSL